MKTIITVLHIFVSLGLIGAVLLHSGKGTGLSNAFGGGLPSAVSGSTMIEKNLDRITMILAIIFLFTSIYLAKSSVLV